MSAGIQAFIWGDEVLSSFPGFDHDGLVVDC